MVAFSLLGTFGLNKEPAKRIMTTKSKASRINTSTVEN
jgi:hypothetical protein